MTDLASYCDATLNPILWTMMSPRLQSPKLAFLSIEYMDPLVRAVSYHPSLEKSQVEGLQRLPNELLQCIVEVVEHRPTLFALLTTSKIFFDAAVKKLWRGPFEFESDYQAENFLQLFEFILAVSPCNQVEIRLIRQQLQECSFTFNTASFDQKLFIDYLALVRHVHVRISRPWRCTEPMKIALNSVRLLPWIICNGQFDRLATVAIAPVNIEQFKEKIADLVQLTKIVWVLDHGFDRQEGSWIHQFVQAFVEEHGDRGRRLQMRFESESFHEPPIRSPKLAEQLIETYRLLAPFPPTKTVIDGPFEWLRYLAHMDDSDLSHIREVRLAELDQRFTTILSRWLTLEKLDIKDTVSCSQLDEIFPKAFGLDGDQPKETPGLMSLQTTCTPPLKVVALQVQAADVPEIMDKFATMFGPTLEDIALHGKGHSDARYHDHIDIHLQTENWYFPKLRRLRLILEGAEDYHFIVHGDMSGLLKLETLHIFKLFSLFQLKCCTKFDLYEPWHLPELRNLHLSGSAANQFDIKSLAQLPKLRELRLAPVTLDRCCCQDLRERITILRIANSWPKTDLIRLERVGIFGSVPHGLDIPAIQRHLPALEALEIEVRPVSDRLGDFVFGMDIAETSVWPEFGGDAFLTKPVGCLSNLQKLELRGITSQLVADYCRLVQPAMFPRLEQLILRDVPPDVLETFVSAVCQHPTVEYVRVYGSRSLFDKCDFAGKICFEKVEYTDSMKPTHIKFDLPYGVRVLPRFLLEKVLPCSM